MNDIDLHVHSNASDGTCSPSQVVELAKKAKLAAIALTDHDTVDGVGQALEAARQNGLRVIPGIEVSSIYEGTEIHILGLFVEKDDPDFLKALERFQAIRDERNQEMLERFDRLEWQGRALRVEQARGSEGQAEGYCTFTCLVRLHDWAEEDQTGEVMERLEQRLTPPADDGKDG